MADLHCAATALAAALLLPSCQALPAERNDIPLGDVDRGLVAIKDAGCGACHLIPGLGWPKGRLGPSLVNFGNRTMIAGHLPNRPDTLASWLRNAPAHSTGSAMPPIPLSSREARDISAYLYANAGD